MPKRSVWSGVSSGPEQAPGWWFAILEHVRSDTLYSEYVASSSVIAELRKEPLYRLALAHARATPPPAPTAPTANTLRRLRTNTLLHGAARMREAVVATSRPCEEVGSDLAGGRAVVPYATLPISRPANWQKTGVRIDTLCHACSNVVGYDDRNSLVVSECLKRVYCCADCQERDAPMHAADSALTMAIASSVVSKWKARRSWPFTTVRVDTDGRRARSLPVDSRVLLGATSICEKSTLAHGLTTEEALVVDLVPALFQELVHGTVHADDEARKKRELEEVRKTRVHSTLQRICDEMI